MKRKNKLKSEIDYCFVCGRPLKTLQDKLGHRINSKKGNSPNNIVIVCKDCKKVLQKVDLSYFILSKVNIAKYFRKLSTDYMKLILNKINLFKISGKYESYKEFIRKLK